MTTLPGDRSHEHLRSFPPPETWDHHVATDAKAHPRKVTREFMLIPTTCFNCESACGLLAHVAKDDLTITKVEGNPAHPGSRGARGSPRTSARPSSLYRRRPAGRTPTRS